MDQPSPSSATLNKAPTAPTATTTALASHPSGLVVHRLPFQSSFRGTTDIAVNFQPTVVKRNRDSTDDALLARFRGRRLTGRVVDVTGGGGSGSRRPDAAAGADGGFEGVVLLIPREMHVGSGADDGDAVEVEHRVQGSASFTCGDGGGGGSSSSLGSRGPIAPPSCVASNAIVWDTFESYVSWEHDRDPAAQDTRMVSTWLELSCAIHQPVSVAAPAST